MCQRAVLVGEAVCSRTSLYTTNTPLLVFSSLEVMTVMATPRSGSDKKKREKRGSCSSEEETAQKSWIVTLQYSLDEGKMPDDVGKCRIKKNKP